MFVQEIKDIHSTILNYFEGIFYGDIEKLKRAFHPQCLLFGDVYGQPYFKNLEEYLAVVRNRKSPNDSGETFNMKATSIEICNGIGYAKLQVPMLGHNYQDMVALTKISGQWKIVNKVFTNIP